MTKQTEKTKPILIIVYGDTHPNSLVGLCPPIVVRDNGSQHHYSDAQAWLWEQWLNAWQTVAAWKKALRAELWVVINGDGTDDNKHSQHGLITINKSVIIDLSVEVHSIPAKHAERLFYVRGTEAHGGGAGELEEAVAQELGAVPDPETGNRSWWHLPLQANGVTLDIAHHPPSNSTSRGVPHARFEKPVISLSAVETGSLVVRSGSSCMPRFCLVHDPHLFHQE